MERVSLHCRAGVLGGTVGFTARHLTHLYEKDWCIMNEYRSDSLGGAYQDPREVESRRAQVRTRTQLMWEEAAREAQRSRLSSNHESSSSTHSPSEVSHSNSSAGGKDVRERDLSFQIIVSPISSGRSGLSKE